MRKKYSLPSVNIKGFIWRVETCGDATEYAMYARLIRIGYTGVCFARLMRIDMDSDKYAFMSYVGNESCRSHDFRASSDKAALASAEKFFPLYAAMFDKGEWHAQRN